MRFFPLIFQTDGNGVCLYERLLAALDGPNKRGHAALELWWRCEARESSKNLIATEDSSTLSEHSIL